MIERSDKRKYDEIRPLAVEVNPMRHAEGSCLIKFGHTHVLCSASVEENIPPFLRGTHQGWVTAEYAMLPRATHGRTDRKKQMESGRTKEIQRLIGRSLRNIIDLSLLGERQIKIDCDVIQADGGTRTASITGAYIALAIACERLVQFSILPSSPLISQVAAISCGIYKGVGICDLQYDEDSCAMSDANFVMTNEGEIVEIQATGEKKPLQEQEFLHLFALAKQNMPLLFDLQKKAISDFKKSISTPCDLKD